MHTLMPRLSTDSFNVLNRSTHSEREPTSRVKLSKGHRSKVEYCRASTSSFENSFTYDTSTGGRPMGSLTRIHAWGRRAPAMNLGVKREALAGGSLCP